MAEKFFWEKWRTLDSDREPMAHVPLGGTPELRKWHAEKLGNSHFVTSFFQAI